MKRFISALTVIAFSGVAWVGLTGVAHAEGDAAKGQKAFSKCAACHRVGATAKNGVGPVLNGIVGRKAGTYEGFKYSAANQKSEVIWDEVHLTDYLKAPAKAMPGNKMVFPGISNEQEIADIIAYLKSFNADGSRVGG